MATKPPFHFLVGCLCGWLPFFFFDFFFVLVCGCVVVWLCGCVDDCQKKKKKTNYILLFFYFSLSDYSLLSPLFVGAWREEEK